MIAVLHLSDLHLRLQTNAIMSRIDALADAFRSESHPLDACFVAVTGDIAFSGLSSEYLVAKDFLHSLKTRLHSDHPEAQIELLLVPGNHDCDFSGPTDMRDLAIRNLPKGAALDFGGEIVRTCLAVQDHYFEFVEQATGGLPSGPNSLYENRRYGIAGHTLAFHLYNTAWLSRRHEHPGTLFFPVSFASELHAASDPADVSLGLLHHPLNWFEPTNARHLGAYLDRTCDVVLTGHEHVSSQSRRTTDAGAEVAHVEGAVLQAPSSRTSTGFNVIWLDIPARRQMKVTYTWSASLYRPERNPTWVPFARNPLLAQQAFENNEQWADLLDDPGTAFTHPRRGKLRLSDLFVYPDLTRRSVDPVIGKRDHRIDGREAVDFVAEKRKVILTGASDSGKTSLAKRLYMDLRQETGAVPILVTGNQLHELRHKNFLKVFMQAFEEQYTRSQTERYKQLAPDRRLIVVDDFDQARFSRNGRAAFVSAALRFADWVLILADDLFMVERLSHSAEDRNDGLGTFEHCAIREFGYRLRGLLVERWHGIGYEMIEPPADLEHRIVATEKFVDTVLGKNLLPAVPLMVLMILQTAEATSNSGGGIGAYGYLYEMLITAAVHRTSKGGADVDTKNAYLAHLAHAIYGSDAVVGLSGEMLEAVSEDYFAKYRIRFSVREMVADLEGVDILASVDGHYSFRYKYIYCYFVARYFRDCAPSDPQTRDELDAMVSRLHVEDYANVLVFYLYLTKDLRVIRRVLEMAREVYSNHKPCDLDKDVGFINTLYVTHEKLRLPEGDPAEHRDEERARLDDLAEHEMLESADVRKLSYSEGFDDILKLNFSLKALHVMGQVLRNFPGSLQSGVKADLAAESYLLGLRTLKAITTIVQGNVGELRLYFARFFQGSRRVAATSDLGRVRLFFVERLGQYS